MHKHFTLPSIYLHKVTAPISAEKLNELWDSDSNCWNWVLSGYCIFTEQIYKLYITNPSQYHKPAVAIAIVRGPPQGFDLLMRGSENGAQWEFPKGRCFFKYRIFTTLLWYFTFGSAHLNFPLLTILSNFRLCIHPRNISLPSSLFVERKNICKSCLWA